MTQNNRATKILSLTSRGADGFVECCSNRFNAAIVQIGVESPVLKATNQVFLFVLAEVADSKSGGSGFS